MRRPAAFLCGARGFTLLETAVAAGLAVVVLLAAVDLSWRGLGLASRARAGVEEAAELRSAAAWVSRDLRRARDVDWALPGRLSIAVYDASGFGAAWGEGTVTYELEGGNLVRDDMGYRKVVARGLARADFSSEARDGGVLVTAEFEGTRGGRARTCVWIYAGR